MEPKSHSFRYYFAGFIILLGLMVSSGLVWIAKTAPEFVPQTAETTQAPEQAPDSEKAMP